MEANGCQNCGSECVVIVKSKYRDRYVFYVECEDCGESGGVTGSEKEAIELWNGEFIPESK